MKENNKWKQFNVNSVKNLLPKFSYLNICRIVLKRNKKSSNREKKLFKRKNDLKFQLIVLGDFLIFIFLNKLISEKEIQTKKNEYKDWIIKAFNFDQNFLKLRYYVLLSTMYLLEGICFVLKLFFLESVFFLYSYLFPKINGPLKTGSIGPYLKSLLKYLST